jgi:4,5-DOPA dioxygenase extradiol
LHIKGIPQRVGQEQIAGMTTQPSLFLSHGAPTLALADNEASRFLRKLGSILSRPDAIVIVSAHHEGDRPLVQAPARFRTWHDFGDFDRRLFAIRYEPPGAPELAADILHLLARAGLDPMPDRSDRLDHGSWVPLSLVYPEADVPLVAVSIDPRGDAAWHHRLGAALAPLRRRNVLIIGSGSISHNLGEVFRPADQDRRWVERFTDWLAERVAQGDREALLGAMAAAPDAVRNHPTDEHLLPLFAALGAGGTGAAGVRLHHSFTYNVLAMDAYAWGEPEFISRIGERVAALTSPSGQAVPATRLSTAAAIAGAV